MVILFGIGNASLKLGGRDFFNNEKTRTDTKKIHGISVNFLHMCTCHDFFSCHFVLFVVKKESLLPGIADVLLVLSGAISSAGRQ